MQTGTLTKTIFLKATPEKVWLYLTDAKKLGEWFKPAENDLESGQPYTLLDSENKKMCWGEVLEFTPHSKLVCVFTHDYMGKHPTTVSWELEKVHGGCQLFLTHTGLDGSQSPLEMLMSHDKGWDGYLGQLREILSETI